MGAAQLNKIDKNRSIDRKEGELSPIAEGLRSVSCGVRAVVTGLYMPNDHTMSKIVGILNESALETVDVGPGPAQGFKGYEFNPEGAAS